MVNELKLNRISFLPEHIDLQEFSLDKAAGVLFVLQSAIFGHAKTFVSKSWSFSKKFYAPFEAEQVDKSEKSIQRRVLGSHKGNFSGKLVLFLPQLFGHTEQVESTIKLALRFKCKLNCTKLKQRRRSVALILAQRAVQNYFVPVVSGLVPQSKKYQSPQSV